MENEELELAALEAELKALEAGEEIKVIPVPEPEMVIRMESPKPKKKRAPRKEPKVEVSVEPVKISKSKAVRPLKPQGDERPRGIRYRG